MMNRAEDTESTDDTPTCLSGQTKTSSSRDLTQEEQDRFKTERVLVSEFKQIKLEKEARKNWDLFYKRNATNFFKDRHWTTREFEELKECREVRLLLYMDLPVFICFYFLFYTHKINNLLFNM